MPGDQYCADIAKAEELIGNLIELAPDRYFRYATDMAQIVPPAVRCRRSPRSVTASAGVPLAAAWKRGAGSRAAGGGEGEKGVDRGLERTGVLLDLGKQKATLEHGEECSGGRDRFRRSRPRAPRGR